MAPSDQPCADPSTAFRGSVRDRIALAGRPDAAPELLVLLATDEADAVRLTVAENVSAPSHADRLLAQDAVAIIRVSLARKLAAQAAELAEGLSDRRIRLAWDALLLLAQDLRNEVRHAVADTLADMPDAPHDLVLALARDAALLVCEPLIRLSGVLTEEDLLGLVRTPPGAASCTAVARRLQLAEPVCDAVVASGDIPAMAALLRNPTAQIAEGTLGRLVDLAGQHLHLREPLAWRPVLPALLVPRLAELLAEEILAQLAAETDNPLPVSRLLQARAAAAGSPSVTPSRRSWSTS
ncbi:MAG: uncharacterized protein JWR10_4222 [Rubritepida sp.]|nr:uncharacterized protein [Rubritepida sp.]